MPCRWSFASSPGSMGSPAALAAAKARRPRDHPRDAGGAAPRQRRGRVWHHMSPAPGPHCPAASRGGSWRMATRAPDPAGLPASTGGLPLRRCAPCAVGSGCGHDRCGPPERVPGRNDRYAHEGSQFTNPCQPRFQLWQREQKDGSPRRIYAPKPPPPYQRLLARADHPPTALETNCGPQPRDRLRSR